LAVTDASCHIYLYHLKGDEAKLLCKKNTKKFIDCIALHGRRVVASTPDSVYIWDTSGTGPEGQWNVIWSEGANSLQMTESYLAVGMSGGSIHVCDFMPLDAVSLISS
jgi:hypothetical protein